MNKKHIGRAFDDFLKEEKIYEQVQATAIKRVIAYQIAEEMKKKKLSKTEMASRMKTSRAALERLLDPENASITLITLERAASALGKKLMVQLA
jgi:DNA-binding Xre family transcriptional regulator